MPELNHFARHRYNPEAETSTWLRVPRWQRWVVSILKTVGVPAYGSGSFFLAVELLCVGLVCLTFLKYDLLHTLIVALPCFVISVDMKAQWKLRFEGPWFTYERNFMHDSGLEA